MCTYLPALTRQLAWLNKFDLGSRLQIESIRRVDSQAKCQLQPSDAPPFRPGVTYSPFLEEKFKNRLKYLRINTMEETVVQHQAPQLSINHEHCTSYSLAAQQNSYPLVRRLSIHLSNPSDTSGAPAKALNSIKVILTSDPALTETEEWQIDELRPGQTINLQERPLTPSTQSLLGITEPVCVEFTIKIELEESENAAECSRFSVDFLPFNYWGGEKAQPELLAAFVKPNGVYVESLVRKVADLLERSNTDRSLDGYSSNTREKPYLMAAALWNVIAAEKIAYVTPPPSFATSGQRIRLPADISSSRIAACLDTSVLIAACLEHMGLNPVIALTKTHAFAGAWLINERFPLLTTDDPMELRKRVASRDLVLFETTLVTQSRPATFSESILQTNVLIDEENEENFVLLLDIQQARIRKIRPIYTEEEKAPEQKASDQDVLPMPIAPVLPPVTAEEVVITETPETRIDTWRRKLLDLTKRNPLISFKDRAIAIRLFCPDIGRMEDKLAEGIQFNFISAAESPMNDQDRSEETFRLQSGSDLHREYALEQLENNTLLANMPRKKMEANAISLLRKAKNDMEEGGTNTLFLALGMLRWKENPEDDRSFRAPLILIPVRLTRKSARASTKLSQIPDEQAIFNLTLIEFLLTEHSIDLNRFRDELPEDDSGIDVELIWSTVRNAIAEQPGFEVVEELILGSFSFAKYLMWSDLSNRIEDLKENLFVNHLVERPHDPYNQQSSFIDHDKVDEKIDPKNIFTPHNCDSSQLVAVEASGRPQDFVLEGPPGTGKSETIANIICHNIALGRKILFVAEKMAALNVVYRRMEKVQLDYLCLELHSNKANKKAVLEQLRLATIKREEAESEGWIDSANTLKQKRDTLNLYVQELHKPSKLGVSARQAISREAYYKHKHVLTLDWSSDLDSCELKNENDVDELLRVCERGAIAFEDVSQLETTKFKLITAKHWSNSWQSKTAESLGRLKTSFDELMESCRKLQDEAGIALDIRTPADLQIVKRLSELVEQQESRPLNFVFSDRSKQLVENLNDLSVNKSSLESLLETIGHKANPTRLIKAPISDWLEKWELARESFFRRAIAKFSIRREAKKLGYSKLEDLDVLEKMNAAKNICQKIERLAEPFEEDDVWKGWDTPSSDIQQRLKDAHKIRDSLKEILKLSKDLKYSISQIRARLVDNSGFLDGSELQLEAKRFEDSYSNFLAVYEEASQSGIVISDDELLSELPSTLSYLIQHTEKFKPWCEWQEANSQLANNKLECVSNALESHLFPPKDAKAQLYTALCKWIAPQLIDSSDSLRTFKSSNHEHLIYEFRELDAKLAKSTSEFIAAKAAGNVPDPYSPNSPEEYGVLARELQKKTRHKPIRSLFLEMGGRLLDLCPCMMMSPLSVAQFLPADFNGFDLVVFDEASQITTWDSVGAIARGKNVIVVGDPKQMPPTNFFNGAVDVDNPDEEDLESILDQALAARLPHLRLKGHYRSRHETLIAFSNSKYYDNSLVTYPASATKESAVSLFRVKDGVYAKGKGRNNPVEAQAVVKEVLRRLSNPALNKLSIGIVTLNTEQQRTIEDLLDDARRRDSKIESFFQPTDTYDAIFVKNLESVQGDERDVIILSLGYGPVEPYGKTMSMNFGPLNKAGGERRLNVAITRATSEVIIFSSFDSSMIDLSRTSALAVEHLKNYLEFAEKGPIALSRQSSASYGVDEFDSEFEESVASMLRDRGWKVQTQIGVSKFRIDLGIIHPDTPGVFLAGVECDGATYHGSPSARDRDRVRHTVLENLGWRIIRIWSTNFFVDPDKVIYDTHEKLVEMLEADREKAREIAAQPELEDSVSYKSESFEQQQLLEQSEKYEHERVSNSLYDANVYFEKTHEKLLSELAQEILKDKNGINLHELALDIANYHGLHRTSTKQVDHLVRVIKNWAGIKRWKGQKPCVWLNKEDISEIIQWRGIAPFGEERAWSDIPFPEALGLAQLAVSENPSDPVDYIASTFSLRRRHPKTLSIFSDWIERIQALKEESKAPN